MNFIFIPIQILLLLFLLFAFSRVILRFREGKVHFGEFLFWSGVWLFAIVGVIFPQFTTWIAQKIGIGRGADAVIYFSLALLFYLIYRTNVHLENVRQDITDIVKKLALESEKPKQDKRKKKT
jgi:hypothetical protein